MSFLNGNNVIDAILTAKGRELLASGQFNPTKFALSDDEIDYGLLQFEDGEARILNTNILEATSLGDDSNAQLKYKLIISEGQVLIPILSIEPGTVSSKVYDIYEIRVNTTDFGSDLSYSVVNNNRSYLTIFADTAINVLNQQTYIRDSGKNYAQVLSQLNTLLPLYRNNIIQAVAPDKVARPEKFITKAVNGVHKFFVFTCAPNASPETITVTGNNTGATGTFTVSKIILPLTE